MAAIAPPLGQQPRRGQQDPQARDGLGPAQVLQPFVVGLPGQAQDHQGHPVGRQAQHPDEAMSRQGPSVNGSQRGGRPIIQFLPRRLEDARVIEGADLKPVITESFILVPNPRERDPARK